MTERFQKRPSDRRLSSRPMRGQRKTIIFSVSYRA